MSSAKLALGATGVFASYLINSIILEKMSYFYHSDLPMNTRLVEKERRARIISSTQIWCNWWPQSFAFPMRSAQDWSGNKREALFHIAR